MSQKVIEHGSSIHFEIIRDLQSREAPSLDINSLVSISGCEKSIEFSISRSLIAFNEF
jgi:hypothetical protein